MCLISYSFVGENTSRFSNNNKEMFPKSSNTIFFLEHWKATHFANMRLFSLQACRMKIERFYNRSNQFAFVVTATATNLERFHIMRAAPLDFYDFSPFVHFLRMCECFREWIYITFTHLNSMLCICRFHLWLLLFFAFG